jgi:hypothetical protein
MTTCSSQDNQYRCDVVRDTSAPGGGQINTRYQVRRLHVTGSAANSNRQCLIGIRMSSTSQCLVHQSETDSQFTSYRRQHGLAGLSSLVAARVYDISMTSILPYCLRVSKDTMRRRSKLKIITLLYNFFTMADVGACSVGCGGSCPTCMRVLDARYDATDRCEHGPKLSLLSKTTKV